MTMKRALIPALRKGHRFVINLNLLGRRHYYKPKLFINSDHDEILEKHALAPHIRSCLTHRSPEEISSSEVFSKDVGFHIVFMGTAAAVPTTTRVCPATIMRLGQKTLLFDAGEGIQRQLAFSRISPSDIQNIFITHLHGDHIFGLAPLLLNIQTSLADRAMVDSVINIYGPPGLYNFICMSFTMSMTVMALADIIVHELVDAKEIQNPQQQQQQQQGQFRHALYSRYPEMSRRNVRLREIPQNGRDGTWTLVTPAPQNPKQPESASECTIEAASTFHLPGVRTFGYVVREEEPRKNLDVAKARALGVKPGKKYRLLKCGQPVMNDAGTQEVHPDQVLNNDGNKKARKCALIGDNWKLSLALERLCRDCDVVIHEATLDMDQECLAKKRGHSSAAMAGAFAKRVNAKVMALNHVSGKFADQEDEVQAIAESRNDGVSSIIVAHDFMEILVPFRGFGDLKSAPKRD